MALQPCVRIALCDDTAALLPRVEALIHAELARRPHEVQAFETPAALLEAAGAAPFDVAVLDIQLPGQDGIELGRRLLALCPDCRIIFLTAYIAYCQDVYDVEHIAFVLKEGMDARLPAALRHACDRPASGAADSRRLTLGEPGRAVQIPQRDILYLEHQGRVTRVHTLGGELAAEEKLESLLARLDPVDFCQTHKSFAVHWPFVQRYDKTVLQLVGAVRVPISRSYQAAVRRSFLAYAATLAPTGQEQPL